MFQTEVVENIRTCISFSITSCKNCFLMRCVKMWYNSRPWMTNNTMQKRHTLIQCNTVSFSMAAMVTHVPLNVEVIRTLPVLF